MDVIFSAPLFTQQVMLLVVVVLTKYTFQKLVPHAPLQYFAFYCEKLAEKVNKPTNTEKQQRIAGLVAILVTLLPLTLILWLFEDFIELPILWHGLLLYMAIGNCNLTTKTTEIAQAIVANNNYLAKEILKPLVLRSSDNLSSMGLSKASIEMLLLRTLQEYVVVVSVFLLLGPLAALVYRLCLEMHFSWNIKRPSNKNFGIPINTIIQIIQWLPARVFFLFTLLLCIGQNILLYWRLTRSQFFSLNNHIIINIFALSLHIQLGGVAMYDGVKLRRVAFNTKSRQPEPKNIIHAQRFIHRILGILTILLIAFAGIDIVISGGK